VKLPAGYSLVWSGQYEAMQRVRERLKIILPITLFLVLTLLYLNTRSMAKMAIIVLAVPFSAVGAIWLLYALGYNMSIGQEAVLHGAVKRIRPKFITVATMFMGLVPIMWSAGAGADVMKRIAAPMIGGIFTSFVLELVVYPAIYRIWKWQFGLKRELEAN
jgi:Cu(I)/Ag(I) efflux system membrane protein CusA/SilA